MNLTSVSGFGKLKVVGVQLGLFAALFVSLWGSQALYGMVDRTVFPDSFEVTETAQATENVKGQLLIDAITASMRRELDSTFGWSANDIVFNPLVMDNRAARQRGVYLATKQLIDLYTTTIAKLGNADQENKDLHAARVNSFSLSPTKFWFPSAESNYQGGLKLIDKYKKDLAEGKAVYNCRTDDIYASLTLVAGENMLGYALGLLNDAQNIPFYTLDDRIYEVQGMVLVIRDFVKTLYTLYPELAEKGNAENMQAAMEYFDKIATYDPLYITSTVNSGELVISYLLFARNRLEDIRQSLRI